MKIAILFPLVALALTSCRGVEPEPAAPHSPTLFGKPMHIPQKVPGAGQGG